MPAVEVIGRRAEGQVDEPSPRRRTCWSRRWCCRCRRPSRRARLPPRPRPSAGSIATSTAVGPSAGRSRRRRPAATPCGSGHRGCSSPTTMTPRQTIGAAADGVVRRPHGVGHAGHQVDPAAIPEADIKPTAARIDREQVRVAGADQQPLLVARPGVGEPAVHESKVARPTGFPAPGVEQPACLPGAGVDGGHLAERGDGVERAAHHQRRVVVHAGPRQRIGFDDGVVRRGPAPRDSQAARRCRRSI